MTAFLVLQLIIGGLAFALATRDPSVAVMPDYHERALRWDDQVSRRQQSDALGWRATIRLGDQSIDGTTRQLTYQVVNSDGSPISGGVASLRFFHHTRAADVADRPLAETSPGIYSAMLPITRPGLWDIEFSLIVDNEQRFWTAETIDLEAAR